MWYLNCYTMELRNHKTRWISKCTRWEKKYMGSLQRELQCFRLDKYTLCCSHFSPQQACEVAVESTMLSPFGKSYISFCQGRSSLKAILYQEILALIPKLSSPPQPYTPRSSNFPLAAKICARRPLSWDEASRCPR